MKMFPGGVLTRLAIILVLLTILAAGVLLLPIAGKPLLRLDTLLRSEKTLFSSREILERITDIHELQTVEYVYSMVFPHDFYPPELSLDDIFDRLAEGGGSAEEILTSEEHAYLRAHDLARETGLPTDRRGDEFVVVTSRVAAGYAADTLTEMDQLLRVEPLDPDNDEREVRPEESRVVVSLPPAIIVAVTIEDLNEQNYPYPAAKVDAEEWRAISSFVAEQARSRTVKEGILTKAESNARAFLRRLLEQARFAEIVFEK